MKLYQDFGFVQVAKHATVLRMALNLQ